jgi:hypothetical protein
MGIEATGAMQWFLEWLDKLGIEYRVGFAFVPLSSVPKEASP